MTHPERREITLRLIARNPPFGTIRPACAWLRQQSNTAHGGPAFPLRVEMSAATMTHLASVVRRRACDRVIGVRFTADARCQAEGQWLKMRSHARQTSATSSRPTVLAPALSEAHRPERHRRSRCETPPLPRRASDGPGESAYSRRVRRGVPPRARAQASHRDTEGA